MQGAGQLGATVATSSGVFGRYSDAMRRRLLAATFCATLTLAGCSSHSTAAKAALTTPADLPAKGSVAADDSTVAAGHWGVVKSSKNQTLKSIDGDVDTFAIKVTGVVVGTAGDMKSTGIMNGNAGIDMTTAVPYYVAYTFSVLAGSPADSPNQQVYVAHGADASAYLSLLVNQDDERCTPAGDHDDYPTTFGPARTACAVAVTNGTEAPTSLTFSTTGGSQDVHFTIPATSSTTG